LVTSVGTRKEQRHELARRHILDAAWQLAEDRGVAGLSLREVARTVGMQAPSLYTYFESKDALFDAMFAEGYRQLGLARESWSESIHGLTTVEALAQVIAEWIRFCQESVARYQIMFTRAIPGWEPSPAAYSASTLEYTRMVEALESLGIANKDDIDLYTAVASGLAAQQLANDPKGDRWIKLTPIASQMLYDNIKRRRG
jgi:AcrR family transcriptional regulator